jgi:competence protein ComGC
MWPKGKPNQAPGKQCVTRRSGFTLLQLIVVVGIITALFALTFGLFQRGRSAARRAHCDMNLKAIAVALDAFAQENGEYPQELQELAEARYLKDPAMLRCPSDFDENSQGYSPFYILRAPRPDPLHPELPSIKELPILVCPFHEQENHGMQAFAGTYTKQFGTRLADVTSTRGAWITPLGKSRMAVTGTMPVRGGDVISTESHPRSNATIRFADGSICELPRDSTIMVLQSFVIGPVETPLYSLVKQTQGNSVRYTVRHGSRFDVTTPAATANSQGTVFTVSNLSAEETQFVLMKDSTLPPSLQMKSKLVLTDGREPQTLGFPPTSNRPQDTVERRVRKRPKKPRPIRGSSGARGLNLLK